MKILVVDDSKAMRRHIINILSSKLGKPCEYVEAEDGKEAVEKLKIFKCDLVLMDWNMPKMSGIDAVKKIRSLKIKTPIIMVTTNIEKSNVLQALKTGANNYVAKPFSDDILIQKVNDTFQFAAQRG